MTATATGGDAGSTGAADGGTAAGEDETGSDDGSTSVPDSEGPPEGCGRVDPNLLDDAQLFACDPESDIGASRQRLRLVDGQRWHYAIGRGFGRAGTESGAPNPFGSVGTSGELPYQTYAGDQSLSDASLAMLLGQIETIVGRVKTLPNNNEEWQACFAQVDEACVRERLGHLGREVFRRPITEEELDRYTAMTLEAKDEIGGEDALQLGIEAIVASPHAFFMTEIGDPESVDEHGRVRLTQYEIAEAIGYLVGGKAPSPRLRQAADRGELETREQIEAAVRAYIDVELPSNHPSSRFSQFLDQWLKYVGTREVARDDISATELIGLVPPAQKAMRYRLRQRADFIEAMLLDPVVGATDDGDPIYAPDEEQRVGLLTDRALLTLYAHQDETDPIRRGKFVRNELLCDVVPDLPLGVVTALPGPEEGTMRERLEEHRTEPNCVACHRLMDPIGLALEGYDYIGQHRLLENDAPVDTSGELLDVLDGEGPVAGARELSERLAGSEQVRHCVVRNVFRRFHGRDEAYADSCALEALDHAYNESGGDLIEVIVALLTSDEFLYRLPAALTCEEASE